MTHKRLHNGIKILIAGIVLSGVAVGGYLLWRSQASPVGQGKTVNAEESISQKEASPSNAEIEDINNDPRWTRCQGLNGLEGYAKTEDLNRYNGFNEVREGVAPTPSWDQTDFIRIPLYDTDKVTVIDEFVILPSGVPEDLVYAVNEDGLPGYFSAHEAEEMSQKLLEQAKADYAAGQTDKWLQLVIPFYGYDQKTVIGEFKTPAVHISDVLASETP